MKKIFYSLVLFISLFIFSNKVDALLCLYEADPEGTASGKIALNQYKTTNIGGGVNYKAEARILGSADITYKGNQKEIIPGFYAAPAFNNDTWGNGWEKIDECPQYLRYVYNGGDGGLSSKDKAYTCNSWSECDGKNGDKFILSDLTVDKTPDDVSLNDMFCTYSSESGDSYSYHIKFEKKTDDSYEGTYRLLNDFTSLYQEGIDADLLPNSGVVSYCDTVPGAEGSTCYKYYDGFSIRIFWNEDTNSFECPGSIAVASSKTSYAGSNPDYEYHIGYKDDEVGTHEFEIGGFLFMTTHSYSVSEYRLNESYSYIDYDVNSADENMCVYTLESEKCNIEDYDCENDKLLTLIEREYKNGRTELFSVANVSGSYSKEVTTNVQIDRLNCNNLPVLYTDCLKSSNKNCTVSDNYFSGSQKVVTDKYANTQDANSAKEGMGNVNGYNYKKLVCELSGRLEAQVPNDILQNTKNLKIYSSGTNSTEDEYNITNLACSSWGFADGYNCNTQTCQDRIEKITQQKITDIRKYCNNIYSRYMDNMSDESFIKRKDECMSFDMFYQDLVDKGILNDMAEGCDFISSELSDKLVWILDLIKIVGPLLALGLGTLDFIKTIASGDADKEMKSAFKRFSTRLIAAVLLFIFPIILSFVMDLFLGNQGGYDPDNPFCDIVKWD